MKRMELAMLIGLICAIFLGSTAAFAETCTDLQNRVVRLHILANSDGEADQALKLRVRDAVLEASGDLFSTPCTTEEAKALALGELPQLEAVGQAVVEEAGYDYPVRAELVEMYFSTRHYENFDLPAGEYTAVRMTIGSGAGRNWWCVLYPPMCVQVAQPAGSQELTQEILSLGETPVYQPKLALVEWYEKTREWLRQQEERGEPLPLPPASK